MNFTESPAFYWINGQFAETPGPGHVTPLSPIDSFSSFLATRPRPAGLVRSVLSRLRAPQSPPHQQAGHLPASLPALLIILSDMARHSLRRNLGLLKLQYPSLFLATRASTHPCLPSPTANTSYSSYSPPPMVPMVPIVSLLYHVSLPLLITHACRYWKSGL